MVTAVADHIPEFDVGRVLFHGSGLLVVDKPSGSPVHEGEGHPRGLIDSLAMWITVNPRVLDIRPGKPIRPVNSLDRETSGVLLLGLARSMAKTVQQAFDKGSVEQRYLAVVAGPLAEHGTIEGNVRFKRHREYRLLPARLDFRRLRGDDRLSLAEVVSHGGRSHLIRSLFAQAGRPLAGDLRYGRPKPSRRFLEKFEVPDFLLHARTLTLPAAVLGADRTFEAPVPEAFQKLCRQKRWEEL